MLGRLGEAGQLRTVNDEPGRGRLVKNDQSRYRSATAHDDLQDSIGIRWRGEAGQLRTVNDEPRRGRLVQGNQSRYRIAQDSAG